MQNIRDALTTPDVIPSPVQETPCTVDLCLDDNFNNCKTVEEGYFNMGSLADRGIPNDSVESLRVNGQPGCAITLHQHGNDGGWKITLHEGEYTCANIEELGGKCNDMSTCKVFRDET